MIRPLWVQSKTFRDAGLICVRKGVKSDCATWATLSRFGLRLRERRMNQCHVLTLASFR